MRMHNAPKWKRTCYYLETECLRALVQKTMMRAMSMPKKVKVEDIMRQYESQLMGLSRHVAGVGIGSDPKTRKRCIVVYVKKRSPKLEKVIPRDLGGFKVRVEESGNFVALSP